jgi:hypothetical protein
MESKEIKEIENVIVKEVPVNELIKIYEARLLEDDVDERQLEKLLQEV